MGGNIRIGRILGIPIEINPSWFLIFILMVWSLAAQVFPEWQPGLSRPSYWAAGAVTAIALFSCLLLHELAHSLTSRHYGIEVHRITLFLFGGVSEAREEMPSPKAEFWIAIMGPLMSFALGAAFLAAAWASGAAQAPDGLTLALQWVGTLNFALGLFNLIPGYPLDGGRVFRSAVWAWTHDLTKATRWAAWGGKAFAMILMGIGLSRVLGGNWFGGFWLLVLGWLLFQAAQGGYAQLKLKQALDVRRVAELMATEVVSVPADATVETLVNAYFMRRPFGGYPVMDGDRLVGLVTRSHVRELDPDAWRDRPVAEAMAPIESLPVIAPDTPAGEALERLEAWGRLPVVDHGRLAGMLSQTDVLRYLMWHESGGTGRWDRNARP